MFSNERTLILNLSLTWGNFLMLYYIIKQVGPTYKKWGVKECSLCESYFPRTRLWSLNRQYKDKDYIWDHQILDDIFKCFINMTNSPLLPYGMGELLLIDPLPPTVSPPYMTFWRVKRGVNPLYNIFVKNFWKNFWEKMETIPPNINGEYIYYIWKILLKE